MPELNEHVLREAGDRGRTLLVSDLVRLIERHESTNRPGVDPERVVTYAESLEADGARIDAGSVRGAIEERQTDSSSWIGEDALYAVGDGRVSTYPKQWHEALEGDEDVRRYLEVILDDVGDSENAFDRGGPGTGVPRSLLLDVTSVLGDLTPEETKAQIQALRGDGVLAEDADQHPDARVSFV
ncbi:hypothetical protein AUR64_08340 [Haloprofundus marisrubri]|uniref:Uncharacterized protein n=1 Tax=Haloprofundus marisrubri TaxID=1514971 RepID=A0A0W1R896_9EURY|nr:hypothetical protein [Haloprofundus marisrubri]KTG09644.1 hypothetical protein AUR64_08340 [Haloprofundus marisrubri]